MSEWTPPPVAQEYPGRPTDGLGMVVGALKDQATRLREVTSNLFRTAGLRALPGKIASLDFDGTDRANLGTAGWMLGSDAAGGSYLALNGVDVIADLKAKDVTILGLIADLTAQQVALAAQQVALAAAVADQVKPVTGWAGSGTVSYIVTTTLTDYSVITFTVPAGYTKAQVMGVSVSRYSGNGGLLLATAINAISGQFNGASAFEGNPSSVNAAFLTGLTPGGSLTVRAQAQTASGTSVAYFVTSASVTFYH